ncbi:dienelactone hydrolase [Scytonema hofmannii PCC 7110]|uniref:Dienelactone hydrolase n=1 Tax=Scytonema hofmannii PCC 7110 TaxID=128403 RepID=A0A139WVT4_9CYAN|nr:alpha/beta hydrolase [Scytonema hofmannii]KYC36547.1 dienelactone hydrolase [Scytonema hofmannii PCC 7110]
MQFLVSKRPPKASWLKGLLCSLTLAFSWGTGISSTLAAETVTIRLGPFQQSVAIADLEKFAKTGKLPSGLEVLSPFFTSEIREFLTKRFTVDPAFADKFVEEMRQTPIGKQIISSLGAAIPGSTVDTIQVALNIALKQVNGLSPLGFLRAYPQENVTVDATQVIGLAVELNPSHIQSQALGLLLERELSAKSNTPFKAAFDPSIVGNEAVQEQTLNFYDRQRNRTLPIDVYWSRGNAKNPLVVLSHGFGSNRRSLRYLAQHLASHGITVVAIEHPGSNAMSVNKANDAANLGKLLPPTEFIDRPRDVSFVLDELAKLNTPSGELQGKFNTEKVSIIGHSLGGYTALALVTPEVNLEDLRKFCKDSLNFDKSPGDWLQCSAASLRDKKLRLQDKRVSQAIALNPVIGEIFGKKGLTQITQPVLILAGTEDAITPALKHQIAPFNQLQSEKYLLTAIGGTHLSISDPASAAYSIVKEKRGEEVRSLRRLTQGASLAFVKQLTPEAKTYREFLSPAYAQFLSTPELPISLVSELPTSLKPWVEGSRE